MISLRSLSYLGWQMTDNENTYFYLIHFNLKSLQNPDYFSHFLVLKWSEQDGGQREF
jgi:hypothetical protein